MKIIKYVDIVTTEYTDEGKPYEVVHARNIGIPEYISNDSISGICPYFSIKGVLYKNVSLITYEGHSIKVVGNYNDLNSIWENKPTESIKGFYRR